MNRTVGLVVPAFRPNVDACCAYVRELALELDPETIRIELDDPTFDVDTSSAAVARLASLPATVNVVGARRGKGAAITAGFCALETDVVAFVDADGSTTVDSVASVIDPVVADETDLAVGTRRHPDSAVETGQSIPRDRLGDGFAWLARRVLAVSVSDYQCGVKAIDRAAWTAVRDHLHEFGFAWDIELVALVDELGYRVTEVPVQWSDAPDSTVSSVETAAELGRGLVGVFHRTKLRRGSRIHTAIARRKPTPTTVMDSLEFDSGTEYDDV